MISDPVIKATVSMSVIDSRIKCYSGVSELVVFGEKKGITLHIKAHVEEFAENQKPLELFLTHSQFEELCKLRMCK